MTTNNTTATIGWPYTAGSCLIDPDTPRSIRAWALHEMTVAELHSYSQRQLMQMHINRLEARMRKSRPDMADPEIKQWAAERAAQMLDGKPVKDILWEVLERWEPRSQAAPRGSSYAP